MAKAAPDPPIVSPFPVWMQWGQRLKLRGERAGACARAGGVSALPRLAAGAAGSRARSLRLAKRDAGETDLCAITAGRYLLTDVC